MKRIVKDIYDLEKGDIIKLKSGASFEVVVSIKEREDFLAICIDCEDKDKIGYRLIGENFNGLNIILVDDYIESAKDKEGKEYELKREPKEETTIEKIFKAIELMQKLEEDPDNEEIVDEAFNFSKKETLRLLKKDNLDLEDKKQIIEQFKRLEDSYKEVKQELKNSDDEVEKFISELEEE